MLSYLLRRSHAPGARPGTLVDPKPADRIGAARLDRIDFFDNAPADERLDITLEDALAASEQPSRTTTWLHWQGDITAADLGRIGAHYSLHPLALEDVMNHGQRPKVDAYGHSVFVTLALAYARDSVLVFEQVSLFIGADFILSFHAGNDDVFAPVRRRMAERPSRRNHVLADYLGYCLADLVVDTSFALVDEYHDHLEALDDAIFEPNRRDIVEVIHALRRQLIGMRKILRNQNEMLLRWTGLDHDVIHDENRPFFRDVQDHARRVIDLVDGYYDTTASLLDTYLSLSSSRLNDIMRVLTIVATIFMPLSFIAGLYGMNFDTKSPWNMPELGWYFGYPLVLAVMAILAIGMLVFFRRRDWL